jgi:hypothetical protein
MSFPPFKKSKSRELLLEELCQTLALYNALLAEELDSAVKTAYIHGWRSTEEKVKAGQDLRSKITTITNKLGWK